MPIVAKKPQPAPQHRADIPSPPPRRRIVPQPQESTPAAPEPAPQHCAVPPATKPARKRGHAQKDERGKYLPTGNYPNGFCRPPIKNQFDGTKPGPGRPPGSRSQASVEREELLKKRMITENGERIKVSTRELATKLKVKNALEKQNRHELSEVLEMARRHFPEVRDDNEAGLPFGDAGLDEAILAQFFAALQLGEPAAASANPLAAAAFASGDGSGAESEWSDPGYTEPDPDLIGSDDDGEDGYDA